MAGLLCTSLETIGAALLTVLCHAPSHCCCEHNHEICYDSVRYPIGGDSQSVTSGVVSRIEVTAYVHGSTELLGMQIDAAINSAPS